MIAARKTTATQKSEELAHRCASIRSSWSPPERDERARQATLQVLTLWALIKNCESVA